MLGVYQCLLQWKFLCVGVLYTEWMCGVDAVCDFSTSDILTTEFWWFMISCTNECFSEHNRLFPNMRSQTWAVQFLLCKSDNMEDSTVKADQLLRHTFCVELEWLRMVCKHSVHLPSVRFSFILEMGERQWYKLAEFFFYFFIKIIADDWE